jgi:hypothetical protein
MRRSKFFGFVAGSAVAWPSARRSSGRSPWSAFWLANPRKRRFISRQAFRDRLRDEGFVEGRDVLIEYRDAHEQWQKQVQSDMLGM